jgi:hypothetical protein
MIKAKPAMSSRQVAKATGLDHKTVLAVRKNKEGRGEIPHVSNGEQGKVKPRTAVVTANGVLAFRMPVAGPF